jgi:transcriptional regulator GlxA family with amidase domain
LLHCLATLDRRLQTTRVLLQLRRNGPGVQCVRGDAVGAPLLGDTDGHQRYGRLGLVVYLKWAGGQSQYSALLAAQAESESDAFSELDQWIAEHLTADLKVEALADRVHMSPRNFARAYATKRGRTPAKAVEAIRVDAARRKLEETDDRIETIADDCGFGTEEQMRCAFLRTVKVPPREYRKRFASTALELPT